MRLAVATGRRCARRQSSTSWPNIERRPPPLPERAREGRGLLAWLADNHFTFLGYRRHDLVAVDGQDALKSSRVGPRHPARRSTGEDHATAASFAALPPRSAPTRGAPPRHHQVDVALDGASPGYLDYIAVKRFDAAGIGDRRGPLPRTLHVRPRTAQPGDRPLLRPKVGRRRRACRARGPQPRARRCSTSSPRFRATSCSRPARTTCCARRSASCTCTTASACACSCARPFERFVSCLIFAPRENFSTDLRQKWRGDPAPGVQRHRLRVQREPVRNRCRARSITVRTTPGRRFRPFDVEGRSRRGSSTPRRWTDDLKAGAHRGAGRGRGQRRAFASSTRFPPAIRGSSRRARRARHRG